LKNHEFEIDGDRHFVEHFGVCCGFPYSSDPEYSVEKINSRQHLIAEASPKQPSLFSVPLQ
jgi:hypothetical protein